MKIQTISTTPFDDQKPGTSGLRKKVSRFQEPHYLANFVQSIMDVTQSDDRDALLVGGDGRFFNEEAIQIIIRMAIANGYQRIIVGKDGIVSTPACSLLIRQRGLDGGIVLSASHNPGGPDGDFGIKYNGKNGGPAPESVTEAIYAHSREIREIRIVDAEPIALDTVGVYPIAGATVEVIDAVQDFTALMAEWFDFPAIRQALSDDLSFHFDAMHAVTGPYADAIFQRELGVDAGQLHNIEPKPDFGGGHPDPNPIHAKALIEKTLATPGRVLGAASDGDGDRHLIAGGKGVVSPSDSLAVILANAALIPGFQRQPIAGTARSMPTSRAMDAVAERLGIPCFETPTGWKFFGNLLDDGQIHFCGEESAGAGSFHVREKDGLWAILAWLNIVAVSGKSVEQILTDHWSTYGRHYYSRHDYEGIDSDAAQKLFSELTASVDALSGTVVDGLTIAAAENFGYTDPVDGSQSANQGIIVHFDDGARVVYRLSGTGTVGATLRVYLESYVTDSEQLHNDVQTQLAALANISRLLAKIESHTGRTAPDVIT